MARKFHRLESYAYPAVPVVHDEPGLMGPVHVGLKGCEPVAALTIRLDYHQAVQELVELGEHRRAIRCCISLEEPC